MDDVQLCQFHTPTLSSMKVFRQDMGIAAVRTLLGLVGNFSANCVIKSELSVELIERNSVAPPPICS
ncbi:MAG: hypothetical protein RSC40_06350, partial [Clostridia bacterium]